MNLIFSTKLFLRQGELSKNLTNKFVQEFAWHKMLCNRIYNGQNKEL